MRHRQTAAGDTYLLDGNNGGLSGDIPGGPDSLRPLYL